MSNEGWMYTFAEATQIKVPAKEEDVLPLEPLWNVGGFQIEDVERRAKRECAGESQTRWPALCSVAKDLAAERKKRARKQGKSMTGLTCLLDARGANTSWGRLQFVFDVLRGQKLAISSIFDRGAHVKVKGGSTIHPRYRQEFQKIASNAGQVEAGTAQRDQRVFIPYEETGCKERSMRAWYFHVPKSDVWARAILSCFEANTRAKCGYFPLSVTLPAPRDIIAWCLREGRQMHFFGLDLRNFYYQVPIAPNFSRHFSVEQDGTKFVFGVAPHQSCGTCSTSNGSKKEIVEYVNIESNTSKPKMFVERHFLFFEPCRKPDESLVRAYVFEELIASSTMALTGGFRSSSKAVCKSATFIIVVVSALHLAYACIVRPYRTRIDNSFMILVAIVQLGMAMCIVILQMQSDPDPEGTVVEWLGYLTMAQFSAFFVQLVVGCIWFYVTSSRRKVLNRQAAAAAKQAKQKKKARSAVLRVPSGSRSSSSSSSSSSNSGKHSDVGDTNEREATRERSNDQLEDALLQVSSSRRRSSSTSSQERDEEKKKKEKKAQRKKHGTKSANERRKRKERREEDGLSNPLLGSDGD